MTDQANSQHDEIVLSCLRERVSRSRMLKVTAAGTIAAALPARAFAAAAPASAPSTPAGTLSLPYYPQVQGTYSPEMIQDIFNVLQTLEHLATTLVNAAVQNAATLGLKGLVLQTVQAALAEEAYHVQFLDTFHAVPLTDTFTVPDPKILTDYTTFFVNLETLETICNAAYMTATREFAELGQPTLAKLMYQAGAVEAEHRAMARTALVLGGNAAGAPPNNKAFETDLFVYLRDAAALGRDLGFIGGTGQSFNFPGTATALANAGSMAGAVQQKMPNNATTSATAGDNVLTDRM